MNHFSLIILLLVSGIFQIADGVGLIWPNSGCPIPRSMYAPGTVVIPVSKPDDYLLRLDYPKSQHVTLEIQNDISNTNWVLDSNFSNTTLVSKCGIGYTISTNVQASVPLFVYNVDTFSIMAMNFSIHFTTDNSAYTGFTAPKCSDKLMAKVMNKYGFQQYICPSVSIFNSSNANVLGNSFYGTLMLTMASTTLVEGNFVTTLNNGDGIMISNVNDFNSLTFSPVTVRNNFFNASEGIQLGRWGMGLAVGVQVLNNNVSNFVWSGLQVGRHCASNYFAYNLLNRYSGYPITSDFTGIYVTSERFGVNNTFRFNYLNMSTSGSTCIYNDFWSTGNTYDTNICNTGGSFTYKQNMGWSVTISNFLAYGGSRILNPFWCIAVFPGMCKHFKVPPTYQQEPWISVAPYIQDMCFSDSVKGISCGTAEQQAASGHCSGLPLLNSIKIAHVGKKWVSSVKAPIKEGEKLTSICKDYAIASYLNEFNATYYENQDTYLDDLGLVHVFSNSQLGKDLPALVNFPYEKLGVQLDSINLGGKTQSTQSTSTALTVSSTTTGMEPSTQPTDPLATTFTPSDKKTKKCGRCAADNCKCCRNKKQCSDQQEELLRFKEET